MKYLTLLLLLASPCFAAPTYLNCTVSSGDKPIDLSVTIDPMASRVSVTYLGGDAFDANTIQTQDEITWERTQKFGGTAIITRFALDRSNLSLRYEFISYPLDFSAPSTRDVKVGGCRAAQISKKAI